MTCARSQSLAVASTMFTDNILVAERLAQSGLDGVLFDLQHGCINPVNLPMLCQIMTTAGTTAMVRVPSSSPPEIAIALDAGATIIVCPTVESSSQAEELVAACFYPPQGARSFGPMRPTIYGRTANFTASGNQTVQPFAMIESPVGMANLESIAAVKGLSGLIIGPADLGGSHGSSFALDHEEADILELQELVLAAAHDRDILCGIFVGSSAYAERVYKMGFDFVLTGTDLGLITVGAAKMAKELAPLRGDPERNTAASPPVPY